MRLGLNMKNMAGKRLTIAAHKRRWALWTSLVVFIAAGAMAAIAFVRSAIIDLHPWGYISLMVAILAALAAALFTFVMAGIEDRGDD
jgi:polyferredoxin